MLKTYIVVTLDWAGLHRFPQAAGDVSFLAHPHRHKFFIKVTAEVKHDNRELEFFTLQKRIKDFFPPEMSDLGSTSCEQLAKRVLDFLLNTYGEDRQFTVEVWEDKENGAIIQYLPE
jgi:hypothetical protein